ncbi:MAG: cation:proton antiporter [Gammaproteobacteria bacterium]|nr:cation:proton antiporter [Gammaproteobacteria bacterium]
MHLDSFIVSALIVLLATSIAVTLFRKLGLGSVLGLLVAGIAVGPHSPGFQATTHVEDVRHFTELGVVLLLFVIGLEMRPSRLWAMRREVLGLGSLQIIVSGLIIGWYFSMYLSGWQVALLVGFTFALSSTAFVLQMLQERGEIASSCGRTAFSILLMQDMAIVPLLAIVPILSQSDMAAVDVSIWRQAGLIVGMLALLVGLGRYVIPGALNFLARASNKEGFLLTVMLSVLLAAWLSHLAGASMALGAFVMGMLLSDSRYRLQIQASIEPFKGLLLALFFVAVGMSIDVQSLARSPSTFIQHTVAILAIKIAVLFALALLFGYARTIAIRIAMLLPQGGEFGFVIFASARALNIIDDSVFVYAIGVISITMLFTPLLDNLGKHIADKMGEGESTGHQPGLPEDLTAPRVLIGGYGRVGHSVAMLLKTSGVPFVAVDSDAARVTQGAQDGLPVFYGDIGDPHVLSSARIDRVELVVLTIDDPDIAVHAVSHIRAVYTSVPIIARARDLQACGQLMEAGATHAYPEAMEASLRLGGLAMELLNIPQDNVDLLMRGVRSDNYQLVSSDEDQSRPK